MKYDGKMVRVKGVVQADFDSFFIRGDSCSSGIWLSYPTGTRSKSGPATVVTLQLASNATGTPGKERPAVALQRDAAFENFDNLLSVKAKTPGMCLGCVKNDVMATLTGRIDGTEDAGLKRDSAGKITGLDGFGNMNLYSVRMVLQSVADPTAKEIDFSKAPKIKDDNQGGGGKDYGAAIKKSEEAFGKTTPTAAQMQRALDAFGGPGVDNGVTVAFDGLANVPPGEGTKGAKASADGLLLTVRIDQDKLKGDALARAIAHQGEEVADLRESPAQSFMMLEQKAWQTTLLVVLGARQKSLTLPGAVVVWSEEWPQAERNQDASAALTTYLTDREQAP